MLFEKLRPLNTAEYRSQITDYLRVVVLGITVRLRFLGNVRQDPLCDI